MIPKLSEDLVAEIHRLRDKGMSRSNIALRLGIDRRTVTKNFSPEDWQRIRDQRNAYQRRRWKKRQEDVPGHS